MVYWKICFNACDIGGKQIGRMVVHSYYSININFNLMRRSLLCNFLVMCLFSSPPVLWNKNKVAIKLPIMKGNKSKLDFAVKGNTSMSLPDNLDRCDTKNSRTTGLSMLSMLYAAILLFTTTVLHSERKLKYIHF